MSSGAPARSEAPAGPGGRLVHLLETEMQLPLPRERVFEFFAAAENLEAITPRELGFEILTPQPIVLARGARIDYRLRLFGVALRWGTLISEWEPPVLFVDEQLEGPYRSWVHRHEFETVEGGTLVRDRVAYRLPFAPLGEIALPLVRLQLRRIFAHRQRRVRELLGGVRVSDPLR